MPFDLQTDCLVSLVRESAARFPDAVALEFGGETLTYRELDVRANRLGSYLRAQGVGPETLVALYVERSLDMILGVLGIHRAGGAYLPIDPGSPTERIEYMLGDSGAPFVLTQDQFRERLPLLGPTVISFDGSRAEIARAPAVAPAIDAPNTRLAYLIYTSGSTGRPKGVQVEHRSVVNFIAGIRDEIPLGPGRVQVALVPLAFDVSVGDIYPPLVAGARVVVASRETTANPQALIALLDRCGATHMQATPSSWRMMIDAGWTGRSPFVAMCGGEALPQALSDRLQGLGADLWNLYGPTEATIWATIHHALRAGEPVTIGHPMLNVTAAVLDETGHPVAPGVLGELFLGGVGIARGYYNRPELTAERFSEHFVVADASGRGGPRAPAGRLYRTGDFVRVRPDGLIDYVGRTDYQVKLRGHRIELGEVEAALVKRPGVQEAVAIVRDDEHAGPQLLAYITVDSKTTHDTTPLTIRRALLETLPRYMVPDVVVVLDALPLTPNGKIDRAQLPVSADVLGPARGQGTLQVAPRTPLETSLVAIWEDVLNIRPIGATDDVFDLGMTSIAAARVVQRIELELGATLPLSPLFQAPTVEKLAALIEQKDATGRWTSLVPVQPHGTQTPVFFVHGGVGTILHFRQLARRLGTAQPFYGLQMQGLYGDRPVHVTPEQMATHYLREMREVQPQGPYAIAGYCFGAIVAFEMARQLERAGEPLPLLINVNGPSPAYIRAHGSARRLGPPSPPWPVAATAVGRAVLAVKKLRWTITWPVIGRQLRKRWRMVQRAVVVAGARFYSARGWPIPESWRNAALGWICNSAERSYEPDVFSGTMLMFVAPDLYREADLGWSAHIKGGIEICEVPGQQSTQRDAMHEPFVGYVSERLRAALAEHHRATVQGR